MKLRSLILSALILLAALPSLGRHRVLISTDIGGTDPDDNQSMIHLLMYANEFDLEGLVSSPSFGDGSKEEILRMIDMYSADLPALRAGLEAEYGTSRGTYPSPDSLKSIARQGRRSAMPLCGYGKPTEGSEWIVECAKREDSRPLWVLVWGGLEDVAQALHDAPEIADRIRVYWIGGPNKKWAVNAYNYVAANFPNLWMIENNASYRGFIGSEKDKSLYQNGYWEAFMKGAGTMGDDFINYYRGNVKMGDTPSLLYLMDADADPELPDTEHWGGRFEPTAISPRYIVEAPMSVADTVACYSVLEWRLRGPVVDIPADSACITLDIAGQKWPGFHIGDGIYSVLYSPKEPARLDYSITSSIPGFDAQNGTFIVGGRWPESGASHTSAVKDAHYVLGPNWYTDLQEYSTRWQGSATTSRWRPAVLTDWARRFDWLREN